MILEKHIKKVNFIYAVSYTHLKINSVYKELRDYIYNSDGTINNIKDYTYDTNSNVNGYILKKYTYDNLGRVSSMTVSYTHLLIPLECIRKEKNKFFIKFYRNNLKGNLQKQTFIHSFNEYYKEEEFPISKEIVDLIEEYRSIVDKYDQIDEFYIDKQGKAKKRQFLFSYRSFKMFRDCLLYTSLF